MVFEGISRFTIVSSILTGLALLFHLIGFGAPYWQKTEYDLGIFAYNNNKGLWRECLTTPIFGEVCGDYTATAVTIDYGCSSLIPGHRNDAGRTFPLLWDVCKAWFRAVQAFETLGLLTLISAITVILLKAFVFKDSKILSFVALLFQTGAGGVILLGVIIFGAEVKTDIGYAFVMCIIGALFSLAAGVSTFVDYRVDTAPN